MNVSVFDTLNNQFMLYSYLSTIDDTVLQYLDNNNININYYCFVAKKVLNVHYLVTSSTTKRAKNGYRLITISLTDKDNRIVDDRLVRYEGLEINISSVLTLVDINSCLENIGITIYDEEGNWFENNTLYFWYNYNKNILETDIYTLIRCRNLHVIQLFTNLRKFDCIYLHYPFFGATELVWLFLLFHKKTKLIIHYHMDTADLAWFLKPLALPSYLIRNSLFKFPILLKNGNPA